MAQLTEQHIRQIFADANARNVDTIVAHYAENASFQLPNLDTPLVGKEAIRTYLTSSLAAFPDWRTDVTAVLVSGSEAVVVNSVHGTHTGPYTTRDGKPVSPTNKKLNQEQLTRLAVNDDGKVTMFRAYGNPSSINRMLRPPQPAAMTPAEATPNPQVQGPSPMGPA